MLELTLEEADGFRNHGQPYEAVWGYNVRGLPDGEGAYIRNADHPRNVWTISRMKDGVYGEATGGYVSAEDALEVLKAEYANS